MDISVTYPLHHTGECEYNDPFGVQCSDSNACENRVSPQIVRDTEKGTYFVDTPKPEATRQNVPTQKPAVEPGTTTPAPPVTKPKKSASAATHARPVMATYDVKDFITKMMMDEFGPGGWIAENYGDDFHREHLIWALFILRSVNGRTGITYRGDKDIAQNLGYTGNNHPGKKTRDLLKKMGFFIESGRTRGRVKELKLSVPDALLDKVIHNGDKDGPRTYREALEDSLI